MGNNQNGVKNPLLQLRERKEREGQYGDVKAACDKVGVTISVFFKAIKKENIDSLTTTELETLTAYKEILDNRAKLKATL
ncbi:MAG: hypothetical protein LBL79_06540 [Prevotella sp.]|jgi:hypothetical protein|nr:hypothetical protein [Prevotella sp.]